jgi:hypothetical protein
MSPQETFVIRLRRHRQRNRVSLQAIAKETNVKAEMLEALERNDLTEWPRGVYARAWVRAYASAIGLDPIDTVDEFCRLFPHGDRRMRPTMAEMAAIVAAPPADYQPEVAPEFERRRTPEINVLPRPAWQQAMTAMGNAVRTMLLRTAVFMSAASLRDKREPRVRFSR